MSKFIVFLNAFLLSFSLTSSLAIAQSEAAKSTPPELPETVVEAERKLTPDSKTVPKSDGPIEIAPEINVLNPPSPIAPSIEQDTSSTQPSSANNPSVGQRYFGNTGGASRGIANQSSSASLFSGGAFGAKAPAGRSQNLLGETVSASQGSFGRADIANRSYSRPGEVLELTPGLIVTQHSGSGKANQFFVRGFNLDHGTDFAIRVDGIPINLPSHAHGQGYLDVNWLIPELVETVNYKLGPYYADLGDFSSAGGLDLKYAQTLPFGIASVTVGQFDYYRTLVAKSTPMGRGQLLYALETNFYNGPWVVPEDFNKFNGVLRWSSGDSDFGYAISAMGYHSNWTATNQISADALNAGIVSRFGSQDASDGGETTRSSLNLESWSHDEDTTTKANAYIAAYDLDLFSNFTFFLNDPVNGDQIEQVDNRIYGGYNLSKQYRTTFMDHTIGTQFRSDKIFNLGLNHTRQRELVAPTRTDNVDQQNAALYYVNEARLAEKVRSYGAVRGDVYRFSNRAELNPIDSGTVTDAIFSPKAGLTFGPWSETELFLNWGQSFHSNDARGVTASVDPAQPLVKSEGSELGVRSWLTEKWNSTLTAWYLTLDSELVFVGDEGTTEAGAASKRFGTSWSNHLQLFRNLAVDADYAFVRPRFETGERIPNAVQNVLGIGAILRGPTSPWYSSLRLRHYGPAALIEDNSARSSTTTLLNMQFGYDARRWATSVDLFNVLNRHDNDITYFYESQPLGLPASNAYHFHPVEPIMARVTWTGKF